MKSSKRKTTPAEPSPRPASPPEPPTTQTILLAVTGMSPAVITETVWALAHETPPVIPDRVVVVTTISGRQALERELLTPAETGANPPNLWQQLRLALLRDGAVTDERLILETAKVVTAPNPHTGRADWLEDLRTPAQNEATANFLLDELRRWTETPDTRLICSIAGGRKTMGALLCACLSLLGRETDRLTHVLVNEPFDDPRLNPKFYFPGQPQLELKTPGGKTVLASQASIELADIPFVALRNLFERDLVRKPVSFTELVRRCQHRVEDIARQNVRLELRYNRREMAVNGKRVMLSPAQAVLMLFLAENAKKKLPPPAKYVTAAKEIAAFAKRLHNQCQPDDFNDWRDQAALPVKFEDQDLRKLLNELRTKLRKAGPQAAALLPFLPQKGRFSLDLNPDAITLL
ncbi:MAG TPA: CRISPR-associated ring nuclease Csm6 [Candidatus Paceibacterota bacterium]|nr:CRISPR-associated ring nuclease Csm6 [Candidatus Paceibacterota bacterium]